MRQVPHYLIIGNGRISKHFQCYFSQLNISFSVWHRQEPIEQFQQKLSSSSHALLLISDGAIDDFIKQYLGNTDIPCIHFSGSLISQRAFGAHPLMTFSDELYTLNQYQAIPFVLDHDAPPFEELFPALSNSSVRLNKSLKAKYHALCVLSGNFSCMLWQKLFSTLEDEFNISYEIAVPYMMQQAKNILHNPKTALTGPLVRKDEQTIMNNLMALSGDCYQEIYQSFVTCYQKMMEKKDEYS